MACASNRIGAVAHAQTRTRIDHMDAKVKNRVFVCVEEREQEGRQDGATSSFESQLGST